ncbi:hypothetical protein DLNHIDIE_03547 [Acidithiobacillus thiooxidans ATCC 19377]|uniref:Uncharacterized protein n=1 Tax=Acidithiobacillus thiooxidans ATCC 19377 TaxID=637390 RepID=A0A543PYN2_ACITH|nr:hypothetical protein DLNHIDIE_03547 [Acidithiobacillus thiooxidans ATCC 19377]
MLGARPGNTHRIHFLKGIIANLRNGDLSTDHHQRDGVHIGRGDAGNSVGGTRTTGHQRHTHLAGHPGIGIGSMHSRLLMTYQHMLHGFLLIQGIINVENRTAGITKNEFHTFITQGAHYNLGTGQGFGFSFWAQALMGGGR